MATTSTAADAAAPTHTVADPEVLRQLRARLRRAQGQIGGVLNMLDDGRSCQDVVTQLAAINKAVDRAAFLLISAGMRECLAEGAADTEQVVEQLQKLFLRMA